MDGLPRPPDRERRPDHAVTAAVHARLADAGYVTAAHLVSSAQRGRALVGPVIGDTRRPGAPARQARDRRRRAPGGAQHLRPGRLRRTRYRGLAKTYLPRLVLATARNFARLAAWLAERPLARTRTSAFARLRAVPT